MWDFTKIKGIKKDTVLKKNKTFYKNIFFPKSQLNYAENLLKKTNNEVAINFLSESSLKKKRFHGVNSMRRFAGSPLI